MFFLYCIIYDILYDIIYYITFEFSVPYWTNGRQGLSYGGFAVALQHIWTNLSHPWQWHAAEWHSHDVQAGGLPASNTLCLPDGKRSSQNAVLPEREPSQHDSSFFASCSSSRCCCWFQTRQQDRQQSFQGQHLDVVLLKRVPQKDLSGGCWGDAAEECPRIKTEGGWKLEAQKIGGLCKAGRIKFTVRVIL